MPLTKVSYAMLSGAPVNVCDYGALGDNSTLNDTAFVTAESEAYAAGKALYIPSGIFRLANTFPCRVSIFGDGPLVSVIKNMGTGDALDLHGGGYYATYENFAVDGNNTGRDGVSLWKETVGGNNAYSHFFNVYSYNNTRHGFYHRTAWATRYSQCKAHYNAFCGYYLDTEDGDAGTHNGVSFFQCDARWNGGSTDFGPDSYNVDAGGIKIKGGAGVYWLGGIIESNNPWGVNVQGAPWAACRTVVVEDVYAELNGSPSEVGGFVFVGSYVQDVTINYSWLGCFADTGKTNYYIYNSDTASINENTNFVYGFGDGTFIKYSGSAHTFYTPLISGMLGDYGAAGSPITYTLLTAEDIGYYTISGVIACVRTGVTNQHGYYPFVASRDPAGSRSVEIGATGVTSASAVPTIAWSGNDLQVTFPAFEYGNVTLNPSVGSPTPMLTVNSSVFPAMVNRMRPI